MRILTLALVYLLCFNPFSTLFSQHTAAVSFTINAHADLLNEVSPNGRLFLHFSESDQREPRYQSGTALGSHVFASNFVASTRNPMLNIGSEAIMTSTTSWNFSSIPSGTYYVQAVWDQNVGESSANTPGNIYSDVVKFEIKENTNQIVTITLNAKIPPRSLVDHPLVKEFEFESTLLSAFWKKPMKIKASVLLPSGYEKNIDTNYPVRYNVAGYGGRYTRVNRMVQDEAFMNWWNSDDAPQIITVFLDGEGPFGDSYQLDSENSGPYGESLITELIPQIEQEFRILGTPETRFVDGCSTGGWVSLALQLLYPDTFGGCYSYSPDPVSFYRMQLINMYEDQNAFINRSGLERPSRRDIYGEPSFTIKQEVYAENTQGNSDTYVTSGNQWGAWNALYSPRGEDGLPVAAFDPITGEINKTAVEHWKKYDLLMHVKNNWKTLGPKIQGKIYVWNGDMDNYYLNNAMRDFDAYIKSAANPKSDAIIEFEAMEGHCTQYSHRKVLEAIAENMDKINN